MKPTLLFIHGLGSSARAFDLVRAQPALAGYTGFAPDLPGFGAHHDDPAITAPFEIALAFLKNYANEIEEPLVVIGHSMGGALGLLLAKALPEKIKGFVSIEGNLIAEDCGLLSRKLADTSDDGMGAMIQSLGTFARTLQPSWQDWADDIAKLNGPTFRNYARDLVEHADKGLSLAALKILTCPKLYIHGDLYKDHAVLAHYPKEWIRHVPDSGHFTMQDQREACAVLIADFLKTL